MINTPESVSCEDNLLECMIELENRDAVFWCGENVKGNLHLKLSDGSIQITSLRLLFHGYGKISCKGKKDEPLQECMTYLKKSSDLVSQSFVLQQQEYSFPFEETLPDHLPTSVYSTKGHIQYIVQCTLEYKTSNGQPSIVKAIRGITICESLDLNKIPKSWFESKTEFEQRKFGWFSCTGGHIRLNVTIERCAFVCGEAISFIGKIENKSDRRIEKVTVTLVKSIIFGETEGEQVNENIVTDSQNVLEDLLAMYIEEGCFNKIVKKVHIPSTSPTTPTDILLQHQPSQSTDANNRFLNRRRSQMGRLSFSSSAGRERTSLGNPNIQRILRISYAFNIKVRTGGIDVIDVNVPVVIGTVPMTDSVNSGDPNDPLDKPVFNVCRQDKPISLLDEKERTLCNKAQLQHVNKYPFYATLTTSSKQSKKLSVIAKTIKTENSIMNTIKGVVDEDKTTIETDISDY
ncbi:unnamed protein product [Caenorhabditis angaria]|uniref:Arrestin C-terminal-like domain-containing protein n=1 Tax=Caenorhabditis angaria TaxID=860376 RepID=A0A9P1J5R3_9PELO|nr:unnamed protein product [Caenorhabditis angaria]